MSTESLIKHATIYVVGCGALAIVWAMLGAGYPWFAWPMLVWGVVLALHALVFAAKAAMQRLPQY